jgi:LPXTG-motif cell wall-anchored protein
MQPTVTAEPETVYVPLGPGQPYKSEGNMQTLDMLYSASTNKQFITVQTRAGETYYMVIDYDKPIDEENEIYETYFLNLVDDRDLMSVVSEDEIQPTPTPQIVYVTPEPTEVPVQPTPIPVEDDEPAVPSSATLLLIVGIAAIAGAAFWFVKGKKNNAAPSMDDYEDEYEFEDEEDESDA